MANPNFSTKDFEAEEWRPVVGWDEIYSVSSLGRVRRERCGPGARGGRILALPLNGTGYPRVHLAAGPRHHRTMVHPLVAAAFIGPRPDDLTINHIDGVKTNNRPANLEYVTLSENVQHAHRIGLINNFGDRNWTRREPERVIRGERHYKARLTNDLVRAMRLERGNGTTLEALALKYRVCNANVWYICARQTWRHVL